MENNQLKQLALDLVHSESEDQVVDVLKKVDLWDNEDNWKNFGRIDGNYGVIGGQQGNAVPALVEKVMNSVDSILIKECRKRGIEPRSTEAPETLAEAQNLFFGIRNGSLANLSEMERRELSRNIYLIGSGSDDRPSIAIIDKGEGQNPEMFEDTFLSLIKSQKNKIPFVQGQFGMGGTGVLRYSSDKHNLQLILSKRNDELSDSTGSWGLTIVRRFRSKTSNSVYKYLAPKNKILSFKTDKLLVIPPSTAKSIEWQNLKGGSYTKLYEYNFDGCKHAGRVRSTFDLGLWERLNISLPDLALPFTIQDLRSKERRTKVLNGLNVRLMEDKNELLEIPPQSGTINMDGEVIPFSYFLFKKEGKKSKRESYTPNKEGVVYLLNGQTQSIDDASWFRTQEVRFNNIYDSLFVQVDCSKTSRAWQEDFFLTNRTHSSGEKVKVLRSMIADTLKNDPILKRINIERQQHDSQKNLGENKNLSKLFGDILNKNKTLQNILSKGKGIPNPWRIEGVKVNKENYIGKQLPTFFTLTKNYSIEKPRAAEINRKLVLKFETDVANDYFNRNDLTGTSELTIEGLDTNTHHINLSNGLATLNVKIDDNFEINKIYKFTLTVSDDSQIEPFKNEFYINIIPLVNHAKSSTERTKKNRSYDEGSDRKSNSSLATPEIISVREPHWDKHNFDKFSGITYNRTDEKTTFYVNFDNMFLQTSIKSNRQIKPELLERKFAIGMSVFGSVLVDHFEKSNESNSDSFTQVEDISKPIASVLSELINVLGSLDKGTLDSFPIEIDDDMNEEILESESITSN